MWSLRFLAPYRDVGLLLVRLVFGTSLLMRYWPMFRGGHTEWLKLGHLFHLIHIESYPLYLGAMAALVLVATGIALLLGYALRLMALLAVFIVALLLYQQGSAHLFHDPALLHIGAVLLASVFLGAGRYSVDGA